MKKLDGNTDMGEEKILQILSEERKKRWKQSGMSIL